MSHLVCADQSRLTPKKRNTSRATQRPGPGSLRASVKPVTVPRLPLHPFTCRVHIHWPGPDLGRTLSVSSPRDSATRNRPEFKFSESGGSSYAPGR